MGIYGVYYYNTADNKIKGISKVYLTVLVLPE